MTFYAGVDGGGTGTVLVLQDGEGNTVFTQKFSPFNLNSIGDLRFGELLSEIFETIRKQGECKGLCIGAAGISNPAVKTIVMKESEKAGFTNRITLCGDHEIALYGAFRGGAGGLLIAGTGTICTGRNDKGETARAGGWGHIIDDAGSGYALGRDVFHAIVQAHDGRIPPTVLTTLAAKELGLTHIEEVIAYVYDAPDKSRIGAAAPLVDQAYELGDEAAIGIIQRNALALFSLAEAVFRRLKPDRMTLTLMGGVLLRETPLLQEFLQILGHRLPQIQVAAPQCSAAEGAALWAKDIAESKFTETF